MERIVWNQDWELGEAHLDGQHAAMVAGINRLAMALEEGRAHGEIRRTLSLLLVYVETHFRNEEALMQHLGFPDFETHRRKHFHCTRQVEWLLNLCREGDSDLLAELVRFLTYWLTEHLDSADRDLARFLKLEAASGRGEGPDSHREIGLKIRRSAARISSPIGFQGTPPPARAPGPGRS